MIPSKYIGITRLLFSILIMYLVSENTNLKPTINFNDKSEYLPILTANIYADLLIIIITFSMVFYKSNTLTEWYKKYRLSAMIADILIGVLYILLARYIVYILRLNVSLFQFAMIAVVVQMIFDTAFYIFFKNTPLGMNHMLDFFKRYAKETKLDAIYGDSILVLFAVLLSAYLKQKSIDFNIVTLIIGVYLIPYIIYMKD